MSEPAKNRGNAGKGRRKGSQNKTTKLAKEGLAEAFERLGGVDALVRWVETNDDNREAFYLKLYPKLLPLQVNADVNAEIIGRVTFKGLNG